MNNFKWPSNNSSSQDQAGPQGQQSSPRRNITCFNCGKQGHIARRVNGHGSDQPSIQQQLEWENVAINSILSINNVTQPNNPTLPQLIRIPILIFDIRTIELIDTGAAA